MKRWRCLIAAGLLLLVVSGMQLGATTQPYFYKIDCMNGYADAYMVLVVDTETGAAKSCFGVDCKGRPYNLNLVQRSVPGLPDLSATFFIPALTTNGVLFNIFVRMADGEVKNVWGRDALGLPYVSDLHPAE